MSKLVLAFDIERSGAINEYRTIAIGASVVDSEFNELESLFLPGYFLDDPFEPRCWNEFWIKNLESLKQIEYHGELSKKEREREMIIEFQLFRKKWEDYAKENNLELYLISDNTVYDAGFINDLIFKYLPETLPIPYDTNGEYNHFFELTSMQKGFLMGISEFKQWNTSFKKYYTKKALELIDDKYWNDELFRMRVGNIMFHAGLTLKEFKTYCQKSKLYNEQVSNKSGILYIKMVCECNNLWGSYQSYEVPLDEMIVYVTKSGKYDEIKEYLDNLNNYDNDWGFETIIEKLYKVPKMNRRHDHNPANDAFCIAFNTQVLFNIQRGVIYKKE